jgi:Phage tail tube protein
MGIGAGLGASIGIATEGTQGTTVTPTHFLEFNSESMKMVKNTQTGLGLRAGGLYQRTSRRVVTSWGAAGGVNADVPFNGFGLWIQHMIGSFGTLNSVVQQAATAAYLQTHTPGPLAGTTFGMQVAKPDSTGVARVFQYVGCKIEDWTLTFELNKFLVAALTIDAWQELTADNPQGTTAAPSLTAPTYTAGAQQFHFRQGTLYNSGTLSNAGSNPTITSLTTPVAAARITKAMIKGTNSVDKARYFIGGTGGSGVAGVKGDQLDNAFRVIDGSLDAEFFSPAAYYDTFAADTTSTLELIFTGPIIASTYAYTLGILIPNIKFDGESPVVGGPGILNHALPFHGLDDETHNPVQFQYMSTDLVI